MNFIRNLIFVGAALVYTWLWIYMLRFANLLLGEAFLESDIYEHTRGLVGFCVSLCTAAITIVPLVLVYRVKAWWIPVLFSFVGFFHLYIYQTWSQGRIQVITGLIWVFENVQSTLVLTGVVVSPFVVYYGVWRLINKSSKKDALERASS